MVQITFTERHITIVLIIILVALAFSSVIKRLRDMIPEKIYKFFDENYDVILGIYYAVLAFHLYIKFRKTQ